MSYFAKTVLFLPAFARALDYPIGISNCGVQSWIQEPPKRAVTMNQGTTEVMLALGLEDSMVGTAYLDDYIWPQVEEAYNKIPVIGESYPNITALLSVDPDFIYASYSSAFATSHLNYSQFVEVNDEGECDLVIERKPGEFRSHCRQEINDKGIQTYLQKPACELTEHRPDEGYSTIDTLYDEIWDIASIFNVYDSARKVVDGIEAHFTRASRVAAAGKQAGLPPISVLWLDGWDTETPFVGACCGSIQTIVEKAGAKNIFDDTGIEEKKTWVSGDWDTIIERDPDLIVLVDASWDWADEKIFHLCSNEKTRKLRAVQNRAFIVVPFSASTLGVRIGSLAFNLAEAMTALIQGEALPSLEFSTENGRVLGKSGVRVMEKLPMWNGTDLDELCPGSSSAIPLRDDIPLDEAFELQIGELQDELEEKNKVLDETIKEKEALEAEKAELGEMMTVMSVELDESNAAVSMNDLSLMGTIGLGLGLVTMM